MKHSEQLNELASALVAVQAEVPSIPKTATNPFFKSLYADLADVKAVADPIITKHGLAVTQWLGHDEHGDTLTTVLMHASGQYISDTMHLHLVKNDPQGQGSATTYARRYAYMAALGLVADLDDDGQRSSQPYPSRQQQQRPPETQPVRRVNPQTGEIANNNSLQKLLDALDEAGRQTVKNKMREANYPPLDQLPKAAQRIVEGWAVLEQTRMKNEEPF